MYVGRLLLSLPWTQERIITGGIKLLENQADMTFQNNCYGIVLSDPVFNIKCYESNSITGIPLNFEAIIENPDFVFTAILSDVVNI